MLVAVSIAIIMFWFASVALFSYSLFACLRFLVRSQKNAYSKSNINKQNSVRLIPWNIVITHCCGLPCAMIAYMLLHFVRDFGFVYNNYFLLMDSTLIPSYVIIIVLIVANISTMIFCSYRNLKE